MPRQEKYKYKIEMEIHRTYLWSHAVSIKISARYKPSEFVQLFLLLCGYFSFQKNKTTIFLSPHVHYTDDLNVENKITSVLSGSIFRAEAKQGNS